MRPERSNAGTQESFRWSFVVLIRLLVAPAQRSPSCIAIDPNELRAKFQKLLIFLGARLTVNIPWRRLQDLDKFS